MANRRPTIWVPGVGDIPDRSEIGGKAAGLLDLLRSGLQVPRGFVVTTTAYREATGGVSRIPGEDPAAFRARIESVVLPPGLLREILHHAGALTPPLAVRSSGSAEDSADHSFAGLHDTVLEVPTADACLAAVRQCWASLRSDRAEAYRRQREQLETDPSMAVIVQEYVVAEASGVVFSQDPLDATDCVVIEAVSGPGEALVSGRVSPARFLVRRDDLEVEEQRSGDADREAPILTDPVAAELARAALRLEQSLAFPVDVEWARSGGEIFFLQCRPITALARREPTQVWTNANAGEVLPDVVSPMSWSAISGVEVMIKRILHRAGIEVGAHPMIGRIAGRAYFNVNTLSGIARRIPFASHVDVQSLLGGDNPLDLEIPDADIPEVRGGTLRIALRLPGFALWILRHRPRTASRFLERLRAEREQRESRPVPAAPPELAHEIEIAITDLFRTDSLLGYPMVGMSYFQLLERLLKRWFGKVQGLTILNGLLAGQGGVASADAGIELWKLATLASELPAVRSHILESDEFSEVGERLASFPDGKKFLERWNHFVNEHGHHARGEIELLNARWAETPDHLLKMIRSYLRGLPQKDLLAEYRGRKEACEARARDCRRKLNPLQRRLFDFLLANARRGSAVRENLKSEVVRQLAHIRRLLVRLGTILSGRGELDRADDIFYLERQELPIVGDGTHAAPEVRSAIRRRRQEHEHHRSLRPPPVVRGRFSGEPAAPVPLTGDVLSGLAVSPGIVRGPARVLLHADEDDPVQPGEILVAPFTDPGWTPYFLPASGIVMDLGGLLSHGSIIAREYGIPAVVNVGSATQRVRTGQWLEVDGNRGEVRILADHGEG